MSNVLVVGSGGREAAIVKKLCDDASIERVFCAPGSPGIGAIGPKVALVTVSDGSTGYQSLAAFAKQQAVGLTIVGPEVPLVDGIVDVFIAAGVRIVGPTKMAARIEGSKAFCKELLRDNGILTAPFEVFDDPNEAQQHIRRHGAPIVVKADGLAAGKGVIVARTVDVALEAVNQIMVQRVFGEAAGRRVVIEECLRGQECSIMALADGQAVVPFFPSQDYKPALDNDEGPNTGGMGSYAPVIIANVSTQILYPIITAMARLGTPYRGVLYVGLMLTAEGLYVLEVNCRLGDPETQVLLALFEDDLLPLFDATVEQQLHLSAVAEKVRQWPQKKAVCLVLAAPGYPGKYTTGQLIEGILQAEATGVSVLHAGTARHDQQDGWVTNGGRVLNLVATGDTFQEARELVYQAAAHITFGGQKPHYRTDIAQF